MWPRTRSVKETTAAGFKLTERLTDKPFHRTALLEAKLFRKLVAEGMEQVTSLPVNS